MATRSQQGVAAAQELSDGNTRMPVLFLSQTKRAELRLHHGLCQELALMLLMLTSLKT